MNSMDALKRLGQNIKDLRAAQQISQDKLAEDAGVDRSYMGMIERGESSPTVVPLMKIARALQVDVAELLAGIDLED